MRRSSSVHANFGSNHASLNNSFGGHDSRREKFKQYERLKQNASVKRRNEVARLGTPAGDRILHRRTLKTSERDLFHPPTRLPQHQRSRENQARWHSGAWEPFCSPYTVFPPTPVSLSFGSFAETCSSIPSSPRSQWDSAQEATVSVHSGSIHTDGQAVQVTEVAETLKMPTVMALPFVDEREPKSTDVKFGTPNQRRSQGEMPLPRIPASPILPETASRSKDLKLILPTKSRHGKRCRRSDTGVKRRSRPQPQVSSTTEPVAPRQSSYGAPFSLVSSKAEGSMFLPEKPPKWKSSGDSSGVANIASGIESDLSKLEDTKVPTIVNGGRAGSSSSRKRKHERSYLSDSTSDEEDDQELPLDESSGKQSATDSTHESLSSDQRLAQVPVRQNPVPETADLVSASEKPQDPLRRCRGRSPRDLPQPREIDEILREMIIPLPERLSDIDDETPEPASLTELDQTMECQTTELAISRHDDSTTMMHKEDSVCRRRLELELERRRPKPEPIFTSRIIKLDLFERCLRPEESSGRFSIPADDQKKQKLGDNTSVPDLPVKTASSRPQKTAGTSIESTETDEKEGRSGLCSGSETPAVQQLDDPPTTKSRTDKPKSEFRVPEMPGKLRPNSAPSKESPRNGCLNRGRALSDAAKRAADERKRISLSAFLDEARTLKHAADKETDICVRSTKFLDSAACFLLASEFMASRNDPKASVRNLVDTLYLVECVFRQGLHRAKPHPSKTCRLAIVYLRMRAFLNYRIGHLSLAEKHPRSSSIAKLNEFAETLLTGDSKGAVPADKQPTPGVDIVDTYRSRLHRMSRAMELWSRAEALAAISENEAFFDAVEIGSTAASLMMQTDAFVLYVREALHRIQVIGN